MRHLDAEFKKCATSNRKKHGGGTITFLSKTKTLFQRACTMYVLMQEQNARAAAAFNAPELSHTTSLGHGAPVLLHSFSQYNIVFASCFSDSIWITGILNLVLSITEVITPSYKKIIPLRCSAVLTFLTSDPVASIIIRTYPFLECYLYRNSWVGV